jgi:hypothetical protein
MMTLQEDELIIITIGTDHFTDIMKGSISPTHSAIITSITSETGNEFFKKLLQIGIFH